MANRFTTLATLSAAILFAATSTPSQAISNDELIDMAIGAVNPDLRPARPVVVCAIGGTAVQTCAENAAKGQLNEKMGSLMADIEYTVYIYGLAKSGNFPKLVSSLGLAVACAAFGEVPGSSLVCNEYAGAIVNFSSAAISKSASIAQDAGGAVLSGLSTAGAAFTCATGIYCPDDDEDDPSKFNYHYPGGKLSIVKYDLAAVWQQDYAPRLGEGIAARLNDPDHLARMVAIPQVRMAVSYGQGSGAGPNMPLLDQAAGTAKYFLSADALGSGTVNKRVGELLSVNKVSPVPANLLDVNAQTFEPFAKELNRRWLQEVNMAAAELLAGYPAQLNAARQDWQDNALPALAVAHFDWAIPHLGNWKQPLLEGCRASVEAPARALGNWAAGAKRARDDGTYGPATLIDGHDSLYWSKLNRNYCETSFDLEMTGRRQSFDAAISWGCTRRSDGQKGLICPAEPKATSNVAKVVMTPDGPKVIMPQSNIGIVPIELCKEAYAPFDGQYCSLVAQRGRIAPGILRPVRARPPVTDDPPPPEPTPLQPPYIRLPAPQRTPAPQPEPSPSPEATLAPILRRPG